MNSQSLKKLKEWGKRPSEGIDLIDCSLALAVLWRKEAPLKRYKDHIQAMIELVKRSQIKPEDDLIEKIDLINEVLYIENGYEGNYHDYDNIDNANMIFVIDQRKGLPIALGLLMIILGEASNLNVTGLTFPGHFLVRFEQKGQRVIVDPFHGGAIMETADLRALIKILGGQHAELSTDFYQEVSKRDLLLRLQNNIKIRLIQEEEYQKALECVQAMQAFAPKEEKLLFDAGVLYSKTEQYAQAIKSFQAYKKTPLSDSEKTEVQAIIHELESLLH